MFTIITIVSV